MFLGRESVMDRRFDARLKEMLAQAEVSPGLVDGFLSRLETFAYPFTASLVGPEQHRHTVEYLTGLLSKLEHKKLARGSRTCMTRNGKDSRSSSARLLGTTERCSLRSRGRSGRTWARRTV